MVGARTSPTPVPAIPADWIERAADEVARRWHAGQPFHANAGSVRSLDAWCKSTFRVRGQVAAAIVDRLVLDGRIEPVRRGLKVEHWRAR